MQSLGYYENKITSECLIDDIGIDLKKIGNIHFENNLPVDLPQIKFINSEKLANEIPEVVHFLKSKYVEYKQTYYNQRPIWFRINVIDQAINDYLGIGFLNIKESWLDFIIHSLSMDRADQGGDGIFTIIDLAFEWAVNFELSQEDHSLTVQIIEK